MNRRTFLKAIGLGAPAAAVGAALAPAAALPAYHSGGFPLLPRHTPVDVGPTKEEWDRMIRLLLDKDVSRGGSAGMDNAETA